MDKTEVEEEEEFNEWVFIQTSAKSLPIDLSTSQNSPVLQSSHRRENPPQDNDDHDDDNDGDDDDDDGDDVSIFREESESSSTVELSLPWRVIETAKKRLVMIFFRNAERIRCNYVTHRRVFWSLTFVASLSLVSSLVYVKLVRWWRRLHEEKLRFLLLLLGEKDQKVKELIVEIGRLNELLSSRRKVRVVRIV